MTKSASLFASFALFALAAATQDGVLLRRQLKENSSEVYQLVSDMRQTATLPGMGDQDIDMTSTMKVTLNSHKLDAATGQLEVDSVFSDIKTKSEGMLAAMMDQSKDPDPERGEIQRQNRRSQPPHSRCHEEWLQHDGHAPNDSGPTSSIMFVEFPDKAVAVGDSWTFALPKSAVFGKQTPSLSAKLEGDREFQGGKVWVVSFGGTINLDADLTEMLKKTPNNPMAGSKATLKGKIEMIGESLIDKISGQTLVYTVSSKSKSKVDLPDNGLSIDTSGVSKTTMTLVK